MLCEDTQDTLDTVEFIEVSISFVSTSTAGVLETHRTHRIPFIFCFTVPWPVCFLSICVHFNNASETR